MNVLGSQNTKPDYGVIRDHSFRFEMSDNASKIKSWLAKFGLAGFLFFLIKGLLWLALGFGAFQMCR
jgi:hypothetical protein